MGPAVLSSVVVTPPNPVITLYSGHPQTFNFTATAVYSDGSVQDMFGALLNGATLYPYDMKSREESAPDLSEFLNKEKITIWHSVPSYSGIF